MKYIWGDVYTYATYGQFVLVFITIVPFIFCSENAKEKKERKKEFMENKEKAFSLGNSFSFRFCLFITLVRLRWIY